MSKLYIKVTGNFGGQVNWIARIGRHTCIYRAFHLCDGGLNASRLIGTEFNSRQTAVEARKRLLCLIKFFKEFVQPLHSHLLHTASCHAAGLDRPSRFVCSRRVIVSINHPGFEGGEECGTLIGRLDAPLVDRMNDVRARLQAEADIKAEARRERREEQARWQREERGFLERNRASRAANTPKRKGGLV
ncbi:hypothetical protein [Sulfitobacter sp.]|uniref:hypothetical protein n=1 Tax=Sulfitobacter sp. TaxID=1903071 RepID=UPI003565ABA9